MLNSRTVCNYAAIIKCVKSHTLSAAETFPRVLNYQLEANLRVYFVE